MSENKSKPKGKKEPVSWGEGDPKLEEIIVKAIVKKTRDVNDIQK